MILDMTNLKKSRLKKEIKNIVEEALKNNIFSGACISFYKGNDRLKWVENYSFGYTTKLELKKRISKNTYFDLASLTKPLVTSLSIAVLIEKGKINIKDKLWDCCGWSIPGDKKKIQISHLLTHSSGLPAHKHYYKELVDIPLLKRKKTLKRWILNEKLVSSPGTKTIYSDLGFILLGFLVEEITGTSLDVFWKDNVIVPLGLQKGLLFPQIKQINREVCVATINCQKEEDLQIGVVHDDNCKAMGGVGGHAGLFGTAPAVLSLCEHILRQFKGKENHPLYGSSLLMDLKRKEDKSNWVYGFDTPAKGSSSSGLYFSDGSRGHLGFTGTSFWIDFGQEIAIAILTNRVHLSNNIDGIKRFRPLVHNIIMKELCGFEKV